jgi:hypothetical protein
VNGVSASHKLWIIRNQTTPIALLPYRESSFEPDILAHGSLPGARHWRNREYRPCSDWPTDECLIDRLHNAWAIPSDGRIGLGFTKEGLSCFYSTFTIDGKGHTHYVQDSLQERFADLKDFFAQLVKIGAKFCILDHSAGSNLVNLLPWVNPDQSNIDSLTLNYDLRDPGQSNVDSPEPLTLSYHLVNEPQNKKVTDRDLQCKFLTSINRAVAGVRMLWTLTWPPGLLLGDEQCGYSSQARYAL